MSGIRLDAVYAMFPRFGGYDTGAAARLSRVPVRCMYLIVRGLVRPHLEYGGRLRGGLADLCVREISVPRRSIPRKSYTELPCRPRSRRVSEAGSGAAGVRARCGILQRGCAPDSLLSRNPVSTRKTAPDPEGTP